jgi:hypothetical protein
MERVHREFKTNNSQGMADIRDNAGE